MTNTRESTLQSIREWRALENCEPVLLLSGSAGVGKSTVATTVFTAISSQRSESVAYQFFLRGKSEVGTAIHTLSYDLASYNDAFRSNLLSNEMNNLILLPSDAQFEQLVLEPLKACTQGFHKPLCIILDALDECAFTTFVS